MPSDYKAITKYNEEQLGKDTASRKTQISMYSDPTHFVYELLQNADDYGATEILFKLSKDNIVIEHNGEPFNEENVKAITYFGESTSRKDLVKTGRFGIGFKSVFAFTATPVIISGSEHFQIYGLYRVRKYPYPTGFSHSRIRIILPFNHESEQPDFVDVENFMSKKEAYQQLSECLIKFPMKTLLFTHNIREIRWEIGDQSKCYSREDDRVDHNARLTTIKNGKREDKYLVFSKIPTWKNEEHKPVEIAFAVDEQNQLLPIHNEYLHVLFPTREVTNLRFILNGPYRTNPPRETISYTDAFNLHLMEVTCELMKESLPKLRDRGFLNLQFLSTLPNNEDIPSNDNDEDILSNGNDEETLPAYFHAPLCETIVSEFRSEKLTPTKRGDHAAASGLYRISIGLSDLISDKDMAILLGRDSSLPLQVDELSQQRDEKGRFVQDPNAQLIDNFLNTLQIPDWNMSQFVSVLFTQPEMVKKWLAKKSVEDHQKLYALLYDFFRLRWTGTYWDSSDNILKNRLSDLPIIRCSDSVYRIGGKCFFPSDDVEHDNRFPRVLKGVYSFGDDEEQKTKARGLLEAIKVRPVDDAVEIEAILNLRYKDAYAGPFQMHLEDIKRFIEFIESYPHEADLFKNYFIFQVDVPDSNTKLFKKPTGVFMDSPYLYTGLTVYYEVIGGTLDSFNQFIANHQPNWGEKPDQALVAEFASAYTDLLEYYKTHGENWHNTKHALSINYENSGVSLEQLKKFASAVGIQTQLHTYEQRIPYNHPDQKYLIDDAPGIKTSSKSRNVDYTIMRVEIFLQYLFIGSIFHTDKALDMARLIWRTMCSQPHDCLEAIFRRAAKYTERVSLSSIVYKLAEAAWIPQDNGDSISFVCPREASRERLPTEGFSWPKGDPHDTGEAWLEAIEFGEIANEKKKERVKHNQQAKEFGFDSADEANTMAEIASTLKEQGKSLDELRNKLTAGKRRKQRILIELEEAPEKEYEQRLRSVRSTIGTIDRRTYLRARYTTDDNKMECQMCRQDMRFKKRNSDEDYFEAVEALKKDHFPKEHEAQHLALCPECAAKYKEFVKRDEKARAALYSLLKNSDIPEVRLQLSDLVIRIWFKEKHWQDLKTVLDYYENIYNPDESD